MLHAQVVELQGRLRQLDAHAAREAELRAKISELEADNTSLRGAASEPAAPAEQARILELERALAGRDSRIADLESASVARDARLRELESALGARDARLRELESALAARDEKIRRLEQDLADGLAWGDTPSAVPDDLKRIRGIGPAFERTLIQNGVTKLSQIAGWTPDEVARFAALLRTRPERIQREGWIESARRLLEATSG